MQNHRKFSGTGTIRAASKINIMKGHRTFIHPITPKVSELETKAA